MAESIKLIDAPFKGAQCFLCGKELVKGVLSPIGVIVHLDCLKKSS